MGKDAPKATKGTIFSKLSKPSARYFMVCIYLPSEDF